MARRRKSRRFLIWIVVLAVIFGAVFLWHAGFRTGPPPEVAVTSDLPGIGASTNVTVDASEPVRGLTSLRVEFVQGERIEVLEEQTWQPRKPWEYWGPRQVDAQVSAVVGRETLEGLRDGPAKIRVIAGRASSWFSYPEPVIEELELPVKLRPPSLQVNSTRTYVTQGGSEAVVYSVGPSSIRDGVQAGAWWFPGHPLPGGGDQERFALFSAPYDLDDSSRIRLIAEDDVGNVATARFVDRFNPRPLTTDTIRLSQRFMDRVVPPILEQAPELRDQGDSLANYLMINGELREKNAEHLIELGQASEPAFLWERSFLRMRNAQRTSRFADRRTYMFEGQAVDQQDHLGLDLASTARAEIEAANHGTIVLARFFGIYGNAVVIDHGYGLQSLYGHLSTISVAEGDSVERGDVIGRSGVTGLAGGDHLHFTMLLYGLPVDPREWWDDHWIGDRLDLKLGDALPYER